MSARLWQSGEAIRVVCDEYGRPLRFWWRGTRHEVAQICNRWRVHARWWQASDGWREYIKLTTEDGLLCLLACDLEHQVWELARLYD
ncbi:MAG: hypothetical protein D6775_13020 [Caldilineae bacterium]|nr:MAG: hypothetical protein D6775_13020 [Caldilineae bacterium]